MKRSSSTTLVGEVFGRLTVVSQADSIKGKAGTRWLCHCSCGSTKTIPGAGLRNGSSKSCGCLKKDSTRDVCIARNTTHSDSKSKEHMAWKSMISRCFNPKRSTYKYYGGRGITVEAGWKDSYSKFLADMGRAPKNGDWTVGRLDNNLDYSSDNCVWEVWTQQARNRGMQENNTSGVTGVYLRYSRGHPHYIADWCDACSGIRITRSFSVLLYGEDAAFKLATNARNCAIIEMNETGAGYSETHGLPRLNKGESA